MIEANPIFFNSGTAPGVVGPPQATVVSSLAKFAAPGTVGLVICCAAAGRPNTAATARTSEILNSIRISFKERPIIVQAVAVFAMRPVHVDGAREVSRA